MAPHSQLGTPREPIRGPYFTPGCIAGPIGRRLTLWPLLPQPPLPSLPTRCQPRAPCGFISLLYCLCIFCGFCCLSTFIALFRVALAFAFTPYFRYMSSFYSDIITWDTENVTVFYLFYIFFTLSLLRHRVSSAVIREFFPPFKCMVHKFIIHFLVLLIAFY